MGLSAPQVWLAEDSNAGFAFQFACAALGLFAACAFSARHFFDTLASLCASGKVSHHQIDGVSGDGNENHSHNRLNIVLDFGDSHHVCGLSNGSRDLALVCDAFDACLACSDDRLDHGSHMTVQIDQTLKHEGHQSDILGLCYRNAFSMVFCRIRHPSRIVFWAHFHTSKAYYGGVHDTYSHNDDPGRQNRNIFQSQVFCIDNDGPYLNTYHRDVTMESYAGYVEADVTSTHGANRHDVCRTQIEMSLQTLCLTQQREASLRDLHAPFS